MVPVFLNQTFHAQFLKMFYIFFFLLLGHSHLIITM